MIQLGRKSINNWVKIDQNSPDLGFCQFSNSAAFTEASAQASVFGRTLVLKYFSALKMNTSSIPSSTLQAWLQQCRLLHS